MPSKNISLSKLNNEILLMHLNLKIENRHQYFATVYFLLFIPHLFKTVQKVKVSNGIYFKHWHSPSPSPYGHAIQRHMECNLAKLDM